MFDFCFLVWSLSRLLCCVVSGSNVAVAYGVLFLLRQQRDILLLVSYTVTCAPNSRPQHLSVSCSHHIADSSPRCAPLRVASCSLSLWRHIELKLTAVHSHIGGTRVTDRTDRDANINSNKSSSTGFTVTIKQHVLTCIVTSRWRWLCCYKRRRRSYRNSLIAFSVTPSGSPSRSQAVTERRTQTMSAGRCQQDKTGQTVKRWDTANIGRLSTAQHVGLRNSLVLGHMYWLWS